MKRFRSLARTQSRARSHRLIEQLETRRLLAAVINGTNSDDTFIITVESNNSISLLFNGVPQSIGAPGDGIAELNGLGGNDSILLQNTGDLSWELSGNSGNDSYTIGRGNLAADIRRFVNIQDSGATAGSNTFLINDTSGVGTDYQFDGVAFTFRNVVPVGIQLGNGASGDQITLSGGNGDNELFVEQLSPNTHVDMGAGNDIVRLGGENNRISTTLPTSCTIDGGISGQDTLTADDSDPLSPRTSITFDDTGLVGGPALDNFFALVVTTHLVPDGAEPVIFRGNSCVAPFVTVVGVDGRDEVQIGEPGHEAFLPLYAERFFFDLGIGPNNVSLLDQPTTVARAWLIDDNGLHFNSPAGVLDVVSTGLLNLTLNGSNGNDVFTIQDMPGFNTTINGGGGNDQLVMGTSKDLDNVFDQGRMSFNGEGGTDTVDLDDSGDQTGVFDDYLVAETLIVSKNGTTGNTESFVEYFDAETLSLRFNNDPNFADLDLSDFDTVNIFGNGGADEFRVFNTGSSKPNQLVANLADSTTFLGGSGNDTLTLNDSDATLFSSTPDYTLDVAAFQWRVSTTTRTVAFDSITNLDLTTGSNSDFVRMNRRPAVTNLTVSSGIGDDTFSVGGGDLDSNGFFASGALLSAGSGNDSIIFDDHLDGVSPTETETYTFGNLSLAKGAQTLLYSTFENQTLEASDNGPLINLFSISGFLNSTTINGGPTPGTLVHVGSNSLGNISGTVNLNNLGIVRIHDESLAATSTFEVTGTQVRKTTSNQTINYSNVGSIELNTGTLGDTINVRGLAAGSILTVNANAGNDAFTLGNGDVDSQVLGAVSFFGGTGINVATVDNTTDPSLESQTISSDVFFRLFTDGQTHSFNSVGSLDVIGGPGGTNFNILSTKGSTRVVGLSGNDTFTVGGGNIDANFPTSTSAAPSLFVDGGGGTDNLIINDLNDATTTDSYTIQRGSSVDQLDKADSGSHRFINWAGMESATLDASNAPNAFLSATSILINNPITPLRINGNGGSDSVSVADPLSPVTVNTGPGSPDHLIVNSDAGAGDAPATVIVDQSDDVENLIVNTGGTLRVTNNAVLVKSRDASPTGFLTLGGILDLAGGAFLSRAGGPISLATFRANIIAGRNGGAWNGSAGGAINSSLAASSAQSDSVGYGLGSEVAPTSLGGFNIAPGDTLLRYTLDGDANLDKAVNLDDFTRLAAAFGIGNSWVQSDSDYNSAVNLNDFTSLAVNFGQTIAALPRVLSASPFSGRLIDEASTALHSAGTTASTSDRIIDDIMDQLL